MRTKVVILFLLLILLFMACDKKDPVSSASAVKKTANLTITVDETPILMTWDYWVELWYIDCYVTASETTGVGVDISRAQMWFIYQDQKYEEQSINGFRLNGHSSYMLNIRAGTEYHYEEVEFYIEGRDDNGHLVNRRKRYDLHYVGLD